MKYLRYARRVCERYYICLVLLKDFENARDGRQVISIIRFQFSTQFVHSLVTLFGTHVNYDKYFILVRDRE